VILSGALLGISAAEMKERLPAILEFSELGDFIDKPVKTYSSGMYVRLAFSAAIYVEPEVLLVDEALSVGDAAFQYKCLRRIEDLRSQGMSILFVTHDTGAIRKICDRAGWIDGGNLVCLSDASSVADEYDSFMRERASIPVVEVSGSPAAEAAHASSHSPGAEGGRTAAVINGIKLLDRNNCQSSIFLHGGEMNVEIEYDVLSETSGLVVGAAIFRNDDLYVSGLNTGLDRVELPTAPGRYTVTLNVPRIPFLGGEYYFKVGVFDKNGMIRWDFLDNAGRFKISSGYVAEGLMVPEHSWSCVGNSSSDGK
jgi:lipopolysaccharide transport system ATP-binding protein